MARERRHQRAAPYTIRSRVVRRSDRSSDEQEQLSADEASLLQPSRSAASVAEETLSDPCVPEETMASASESVHPRAVPEGGSATVVPNEEPSPAQGSIGEGSEGKTSADGTHPLVRPNADSSPLTCADETGQVVAPPQRLYQLRVQPIVKETLAQRDSSGSSLEAAVFDGASFPEIMEKLWNRYAARVQRQAVKTDGVWSTEEPNAREWAKVMQFKVKKHLVDCTKPERMWNQWLAKMRGQTVTLLIYAYGIGMRRAEDLETFKSTYIRLEHVGQAGATAGVSLRDIVAGLQGKWGATFQAAEVVWRMWGNHITRNPNRARWNEAIEQPPPRSVVNLLRPADSMLEQRLTSLKQSANVALECVRSSLEDYQQLRRDWEAFGRRLEEHERHLVTRQTIIEGFIRDITPSSPNSMPDPSQQLENTADTEHTD